MPGGLLSLAAVLASQVHCAVLAIDSHVDVPRKFATAEVDPGVDGSAQLTLPKMRRGCLDAAFFVAAVGQDERTPAGYQRAWDAAREMIAGVHRMVERYPQQIALAGTADDITRLASEGRLAAVIGLENGYPVGEDLGRVRELYRLGVRYITLTHVGHNAIADSSVPIRELGDREAEHGGLSPFGRRLIAEMNCLGMMVDVSHTSRATTLQAIEASRAPVIASHSGARAVADTPRNLDDTALRALAARGGVVQVVGYSSYVKPNDPAKDRAIAQIAREMGLDGPFAWARVPNATLVAFGDRLVQLDGRWPRAGVADFVDHIDYIVALVGIDHVGVGSDFYAGGGAASGGLAGWMDVSQGAHITAELLRRGYDAAAIAKIWGGNLLRVMRAAEAVARGCPRTAAPTAPAAAGNAATAGTRH
ncbi:MAG: dipeptidase [Steroidobacteraceae bacterium]